MKQRQRLELYAQLTGLSRAELDRYRTSSWGRFRDQARQKFSAAVQTLEGAAAARWLTREEFRLAARALLAPVRAYARGRIETVDELVATFALAFEQLLGRSRRAAVAVAPALPTLLARR